MWLLSLEFCQREVELRSRSDSYVIKLFVLVKFSGNACFLDYMFILLHYFAVSSMPQSIDISLAVIDAKGNGFPKVGDIGKSSNNPTTVLDEHVG